MESHYYYLGGEPFHAGIYVDFIRRLADEGVVVDFVPRLRVSLNPATSWVAWKHRHLVGPNPIEAIRGRIPGQVRQLPILGFAPQLSAPFLERIVAPSPERRIVLHARQIVMGHLALALKRRHPAVRVITELEGDPFAEAAYKRADLPPPSLLTGFRWAAEDGYFDRQERRIVEESDRVLCVSQKLKDVLIRRYQLGPERAARIVVLPGVASRKEFRFDPAKRQEIRQALGLENRLVVVYNGNLNAKWQVPEKLIEVFSIIRQSRADACFLILTPAKDRAFIEPLLERWKVSPEDYRILSLRHGEVVDHLCAADRALLLRDRHPMNEVAAPSKFAEYVLTGLPIVMTEGIGDFSDAVRGSEFACVLPGLDDLDAEREAIQRFCRRDVMVAERESFGRWCGERFATELSVPRLAALYREV